MNIKTIFLYDDVEEIIYVTQLINFKRDNKNKICKFKKTLYGLK